MPSAQPHRSPQLRREPGIGQQHRLALCDSDMPVPPLVLLLDTGEKLLTSARAMMLSMIGG